MADFDAKSVGVSPHISRVNRQIYSFPGKSSNYGLGNQLVENVITQNLSVLGTYGMRHVMVCGRSQSHTLTEAWYLERLDAEKGGRLVYFP